MKTNQNSIVIIIIIIKKIMTFQKTHKNKYNIW